MTEPEQKGDRSYTVILRPEPEGGYTVFAPSLPGLVTFGDTEAEALDMAREAIELYLEEVQTAGEPLPVESGPVLTRQIRVTT